MTISRSGMREEPRTCHWPGHAGLELQAAAVRALDAAVLVGYQRARADEAHLAAQDVEQLGQLVERAAAQQPPGPGHARVVGDLEQPVGLVERHAARPCVPRRRRPWCGT